MKKFLFFLMATVTLATGAVAKHNCGCEGCEICKVEDKLRHKQMHKGGFTDEAVAPVSVARAATLPDESHVTVIGRITNQMGKNTYNFTDGSDSMIAHIGKKDWHGQIVSPKDKVILKGKVVKDDGITYFDVKSVKKVK